MPSSKSPTAKMTVGATVSRDVVAAAKVFAAAQERSFSYVVEKALIAYLRDPPSTTAPPR